VVAQPLGEFVASPLTRGDVKHQGLLLVNTRVDFQAVQDQEDFHRRVPDAFVAVDERMVRHEGKSERCRFVDERGIEVDAVERDLRLGQGGFQQPEVADACEPSD
jgi:hypothetical protein